ncbi:c-type cytochrome biogenesis protein CcsB [Nocardioides sp. NPDC057767]|jgi:cytochrome c-type biogenesis protein CcsB|uniref:Cytochrome c-type biogenesis protein CcsB n=1 Tax=Nocardioides albertanoniae TaxID=1175486 RepID=A0A543A3Q4_9ACTN|nr:MULTISPECIES: c-type cytochrome biogenesis protein CcsB [Nocardioides]TQL67221.1 cytochrome c-type biogenesis protein CcsB [Nocardioides albertanoniae]
MNTQTFAELSDSMIYSAIAIYGLALLAYAAESAGRVATSGPRVRQSNRLVLIGAVGTSLTVLAFLLNVGGVATRALATQRAPWGNMYEFVIVAALASGGAYLIFLRRQPVRTLGVWVVAVLLLALGLAVTVLYTPAGSLVPVLNSYWLVIHVAAAITASGIFTVGFVAAALFLVRIRSDKRQGVDAAPSRRYAATLPAAEILERVAHGAAMFAFPIWTFAVIAGAIWAENSWGRYWGWDPKETWAFITWVLYAAYLHAQSTVGWRGARASWFAIAGYLALLFNLFGVNLWITGLHSYAGV